MSDGATVGNGIDVGAITGVGVRVIVAGIGGDVTVMVMDDKALTVTPTTRCEIEIVEVLVGLLRLIPKIKTVLKTNTPTATMIRIAILCARFIVMILADAESL